MIITNIENNQLINVKKKVQVSDLGHRYVDRGDPAAFDFAVGDLTTDGNWHDLDLSSIVPAGAVAVHLRVYAEDDVLKMSVLFRKNGNSNTINAGRVQTYNANARTTDDVIVALDSNRIIEYLASNVVWIDIKIVVAGWYI
jgi:hypothetical protein